MWLALNTIANLVTAMLMIVLFSKLGFFARKPSAPKEAKPEILTWSPIDATARSKASIPVRDLNGNVANAWCDQNGTWMYSGTREVLHFEPVEYRSSM